MSESMIERVAAALRSLPWEGGVFQAPKNVHDDAEDIARAAIEAMREPTEAVLSAVSEFTIDDFEEPCREIAALAWDEAIDAALSPNTAEKAS